MALACTCVDPGVCNLGGPCLPGHPTCDAGEQSVCAVGAQATVDVLHDPAYRGGPIGLALLTPEAAASGGACAAGDCCATLDRVAAGEGNAFYSQAELNPDQEGGQPWLHFLAYRSALEGAYEFYNLAFNDRYAGGHLFSDLVVRLGPVTPHAGTCFDAAACDDGDVCNGAEGCYFGLCGPGTALDCDDRSGCTADACDPADGCSHATVAAGTACEEAGTGCRGSCDAAGACAIDPACPDSGGGCRTAAGAAGPLALLGALAACRRRARRAAPAAR